jgi:uncharacterized protein (TIGR03437 family)
MKARQIIARKLSLLAVSIVCGLVTLVSPGWRNNLRALEYLSLANCGLPNALQLTARIGDAPSTHSIYVGNDLTPGCSVTAPEPFTASVTYLNGGSNWLAVSPATGTLQQGVRNSVRVTFTPASLPASGTYQGFVHIRLSNISGTISIPVSAALSAPTPQLALSWSSVVFQAVTRTGIPPTQTVVLNNSGTGTLEWSLDTAAIPSWLNVSPRSGSLSASEPGTALTIGPNTAALDGNVYTALLPFRSNTARNSPQYLSVTYHVVQPTAGAVPQLTAYGLTFTAQAGSTTNMQKSFVFSNTGGASVTGQFTSTAPAGNWLNVSPGNATATSGNPVTVQATVNPTGLAAGVYRGTITATFSIRQPQTVDVVLIVTPGTPPEPPNPPRPPTGGNSSLANCTPSSMAIVGSTIGNGSNSPVSFPQALLAQLVDNCGEPIANGTVIATAGGVSIPMTNTGGGYYSGTWTPAQTASAVNITFAAFHPSFNSVQQAFNVAAITASGGTVLPVLFNEGVVEGAAFTARRPLVPGGIVSLFGSGLASSIAAASTIPLERQLGVTSVRIAGVEAPLYFVSPGQVNAQVPYESRPGDTVSIVVNVGGRITTPQNYQIAPAQPGIFTDSIGPAILDDQFRRVTAPNPARVGKIIQIFGGGLGDTLPAVNSGDALAVGSDAIYPVSVEIGGVEAPVQYDGLAPGYVGLYQINVSVPNVPAGPAVPIVLRQNGVPANPSQNVTIPIAP